MLYNLELFLRPFKILLFMNVHNPKDSSGAVTTPAKAKIVTTTQSIQTTSSTVPPTSTATTTISHGPTAPVHMVTNPTTSGTPSPPISTSALTLPIPMTEFSSTPSPTASDPRVGWVYTLQKAELQNELRKYHLDAEGTVAQLRPRLVNFLRTGYGVTHPETSPHENPSTASNYPITLAGETASFLPPRNIGRNTVVVSSAHGSIPAVGTNMVYLETSSVREILGLSPNADFRTVQETLLELTKGKTDVPTTTSDEMTFTGLPSQTTKPTVYFTPSTHPSSGLNHPGPQGPAVSAQAPWFGHAPESSLMRAVCHSVPTAWQTSYQTTTPNPWLHPSAQTETFLNPQYLPTNENRDTRNEIAHICNQVRKWNLRFDGDKDPISFIERLMELTESYDIKPEPLLKALPELFKGEALLWYRNNKDLWTTYNDFLQSFEEQFLPPDYQRRLDEEINRRTQGEDEPIRKYIVALSTLMRRSGRYSRNDMLNKMYTNMRPEYKLMVRRDSFNSISGLVRQAEGYESYLREKRNYRPPPNPAQSWIAETAYVTKTRGPRQYQVDSVERTSLSDRRAISYDNSCSRYPPKDNPPKYFSQRSIAEPNAPKPNTEPKPLMTTRTPENKIPVCWNCEKQGHRYHDCREQKHIRCYNCKREGIRTVHCPCRSENFSRGRITGGVPSLESQRNPPKTGNTGSNL